MDFFNLNKNDHDQFEFSCTQDVDDPLLDAKTPSLFVIGQHATTSTIDNMEDYREKVKAENSLLIIGGGDNNLRIKRAKKKQQGITQIMADKLILVSYSTIK